MSKVKERIKKRFLELYEQDCIVVRSPGRINLIGEHTDYNDGFVLPAAIDKAVYVAIANRDDAAIHLYAEDYQQSFETNLHSIHPSAIAWANYVLGVVNELQKNKYALKGFNAVVSGDLPIGAGLSSSAAVECAVAFALNELNGLKLSRLQMAKMTQQAEHHFAGVNCGIMDMFASLMGQKNKLMKLDCRSLDVEYIPLHMDEYKIVLFNTHVKHSLASSAYNKRREECLEGVRLVQKHYPQVESLRDITTLMLDRYVQPIDLLVDKRCRFIVEEIARLQEACIYLSAGDLASFGKKMFATHHGLSKAYEVSCKELDYLVEKVHQNNAVIGARMMGGGFGGCTINLVKEDQVNDLISAVGAAYEQDMQLPFSAYTVEVENGTELVLD